MECICDRAKDECNCMSGYDDAASPFNIIAVVGLVVALLWAFIWAVLSAVGLI